MEVLETFRHEYKYLISYEDMLKLRSKLNKLLHIDRNINGYMIRSLYFDSVNDDDYYDKLGGEINRKKVRLRIYEPNTDFIKLEIKAKYDIHQLKRSMIINRKIANELIKGNYSVLLDFDNDVAHEAYLILKGGLYKPKTIIEYQRIAYTTKTTTRITFDFNIRSTNNIKKFFDEKINYNNIATKKDVVLEVKFDSFLEPYISYILADYSVCKQSVSKYIMARNI